MDRGGTAVPNGRCWYLISIRVRSNGSKTSLTLRPTRAASTSSWLACSDTVAVLVTVRSCDQRKASLRRLLWAAIAKRLAECGLELNERKTRIVYCKDDDRRGSYEHTSF
jgi:hypothetical protein